jgi:hypothetical protein
MEYKCEILTRLIKNFLTAAGSKPFTEETPMSRHRSPKNPEETKK